MRWKAIVKFLGVAGTGLNSSHWKMGNDEPIKPCKSMCTDNGDDKVSAHRMLAWSILVTYHPYSTQRLCFWPNNEAFCDIPWSKCLIHGLSYKLWHRKYHTAFIVASLLFTCVFTSSKSSIAIEIIAGSIPWLLTPRQVWYTNHK